VIKSQHISSSTGDQGLYYRLFVLGALLILVLVALFLRWNYATSISPFIDEFVTIWAARNIAEGVASPLVWGPGNDAILFKGLDALLFFLFGSNLLVARIPSIMISVFTIPVLYFVGKRIFSAPVGLMAAALLTFDLQAITWGGRARMYPLLQLFVLLSLFFFYEGVVKPETSRAAKYRWLFSLSFMGAIFSHLEAILLFPAFIMVALLRKGPRGILKEGLFWPFLLSFGGISLALGMWRASQNVPGLIPLWSEGAISPFLRFSWGLKNWGLFRRFFLEHLPLTLLFLLGLLYLVIWTWRGNRHLGSSPGEEKWGLAVLYIPFLVAGGQIIFLLGPAWGDEPRYLFFLLPIFFLAASQILYQAVLLLESLLRRLLPKWGEVGGSQPNSWAMLVVVTLSVAAMAWPYLSRGVRFKQEWGYDLAFGYVGKRWQEGDVVGTVSPLACLVSLGHCDYFVNQKPYETYALEREGVLVGSVGGLPVVLTRSGMEEILEAHSRVWFIVDEGRLRTRYNPAFVQLIWDRMDLVANERGALVFLSREEKTPSAHHSLEVNLGDKFALLGYDLSAGHPKPGEELALTLYWQGIEYANYFGQDYTVFVHLVDKGGVVWAQSDSPPVKGLFPTSRWRETEIVIPDRRDIRLPDTLPPGRYRLEAGMYLLATGEWLPLLNEKGESVGDSVTLDYTKVLSGEGEFSTPENHLRADLGGQATLLGYDLRSRGVKAGDSLLLTLYWRAQREMDKDYTVFIHLVDEEGKIWAQEDNQPEGGFYPTSFWDEGEIVRDEHELLLAADMPEGEYELRVGMYILETMERLMVIDSEEKVEGEMILLGTVRVGGHHPGDENGAQPGGQDPRMADAEGTCPVATHQRSLKSRRATGLLQLVGGDGGVQAG